MHHHFFSHLRGLRFAREGFGHGDHDGRDHGGRDHGGRDHGAGRGPFGRHREGRGGGRMGRVFDHGELRLVVLAMIADKPSHGYEIIKAIEDRLAGSYSPSPGVIYPTLTMLEELGHAEIAESGGKKLYAVTAEGKAYLAANAAAVDAALNRMADVRAAHGGGPSPQVLRAFENLKLALRFRQGRGPLTNEQVQAIAAALDAAAVAVERS